MWLGANMRTIITAGVSVAIFGMILNLYTGFQQTDPEKIKLIRTLQGNRRDELFKVVLPGTIPLFISILKVTSASAWWESSSENSSDHAWGWAI